MADDRRWIRLHSPKGDRWRSAIDSIPEALDAYITLNLPSSLVSVSLRPDVDEARLEEIAHLFEEALDAGSGRVEVMQPPKP